MSLFFWKVYSSCPAFTAPVQCNSGAEQLPSLLFGGFLKITSGEGFYGQQAGKTREQREIGCLCVLSDHEGILVDFPNPCLLQFVIAVYKMWVTIYLAGMTHSHADCMGTEISMFKESNNEAFMLIRNHLFPCQPFPCWHDLKYIKILCYTFI